MSFGRVCCMEYLIVWPLSFIAGYVDAIAGGGGLISLPAYIFAGLPVHNAIGTNKLSSSMGTLLATIRYAINGEAALAVMDEWVPDIVLTDMWMPRMDGTQLAEMMRKDRRLAEIPVVAVTADVDIGSSYDMSLFAKIISKPVTAAKLRALFGIE